MIRMRNVIKICWAAALPLTALVKFEPRAGPEFTMRYNLYRSAQIIGSAAPG